ncbi:YiiD C-terminal domain-containing protein [Rubrivirga sp.]|uniref:YiiD C-terminal domain-containing protein n=1 Tax=Rubrivirga sp. TaxID=1885344 RepID=UPI003C71602B
MTADVEAYLHVHIPISSSMGISALEAGPDKVVLSAPLAANVNHRSTMFGGSESALAILSAWTLLHVHLRNADFDGQIVIQRNSMEYLRPVLDEAVATCYGPASWDAFDAVLARRGRARVTLEAEVASGGEVVGRFSGVYVALAR